MINLKGNKVGVMIFILNIIIPWLIYSSSCLANPKLSVVASLFPLQEFASAVGNGRVTVDLLLPPGAEPHTWEPKPSDLVKISKADIFLYLGAGMEPWVHDLLKGVKSPSLRVIEVSQGLALRESLKEADTHSDRHMDVHIWLDFHYDQIIVGQIAKVFSSLDPEGADFYCQNTLRYQRNLSELDQKYRAGLRNCCHRKIFLAGHSAFGYLARRYHLEQFSLYGISPDAEPTPKRLAEVVDTARKHHVKAIYFESLVNDRLAQVLAKEIGALVLELNPGANLTKEQMKSRVTFLGLMEENLKNLQEGLICE